MGEIALPHESYARQRTRHDSVHREIGIAAARGGQMQVCHWFMVTADGGIGRAIWLELAEQANRTLQFAINS